MTKWIEISGQHFNVARIVFFREDASFYKNLGEADRGKFKPRPQPKPGSSSWEVGGVASAIDGLPVRITDSALKSLRDQLPESFLELRERNQQSSVLVNMEQIDAVTREAGGSGSTYAFWTNLSGSRKKVLSLNLAEPPC